MTESRRLAAEAEASFVALVNAAAMAGAAHLHADKIRAPNLTRERAEAHLIQQAIAWVKAAEQDTGESDE